jgi:hypothetical protein
MAKRRRRRRVRKVAADVPSIVTSARAASKAALQQLRKEIRAPKPQLESLSWKNGASDLISWELVGQVGLEER